MQNNLSILYPFGKFRGVTYVKVMDAIREKFTLVPTDYQNKYLMTKKKCRNPQLLFFHARVGFLRRLLVPLLPSANSYFLYQFR